MSDEVKIEETIITEGALVETEEPKTHRVLSFTDIVNADDIEVREVFIPQWDGVVKVKVFTKAEQQEIRRQITASQRANDGNVDADMFERLVITSGLVEPKVSDQQYQMLLQKSATAIQELAKAIVEINGMGEEDVDKKEKTFQD